MATATTNAHDPMKLTLILTSLSGFVFSTRNACIPRKLATSAQCPSDSPKDGFVTSDSRSFSVKMKERRDRLLCWEMMLTEPMEPNKSIPETDTKVETKPVKEIVEPVTTVPDKVSVNAALEELKAQNAESSFVTSEDGKLLGSVSKDEMNRKVGGLGHDPEAWPVELQVEKPTVCCFEDQTIGEAEKVMLDAKVEEVPVVTQDQSLVGKTTLEAIAQKKGGENSADPKADTLER